MDAVHTFIVSLSITLIGYFLKYLFSKKPRLRYYYGAITEIPFPVTSNISTNTQPSASPPINVPVTADTPPNASLQSDALESSAAANPIATTVNFVRTHTVIILNQGNATAHNVRIGHYFLPAYSVTPQLNSLNPGNANEILITALCPKEFFSISYLYGRPVVWSNINSYFKCDEGMAEFANMQDVRIKSSFLIGLINVVFFAGIFSVIYFTIKILPFMYKLYLVATS